MHHPDDSRPKCELIFVSMCVELFLFLPLFIFFYRGEHIYLQPEGIRLNRGYVTCEVLGLVFNCLSLNYAQTVSQKNKLTMGKNRIKTG